MKLSGHLASECEHPLAGPTTQLRDYCHMATQTDRPPPRPKAHPHFVAATQTGGDWARRQDALLYLHDVSHACSITLCCRVPGA